MSQDGDPKAAITRFWDELAPRWAANPRAVDLEPILARLGCAPPARLLDAGCGDGIVSLLLARAGYRVHGVDLSPAMVALAEQAARQQDLYGDAVRFAVGDVERLPLPDAACDAVLCRNVLDFTPHPGVALAEFRRVLARGGLLLLTMLGAHSPVKSSAGVERWRRFLPEPPPVMPLNDILPWEMEALLDATGWRVIEQVPQVSGTTFSGPAGGYTQEQVEALPDRVLQQAAATTWLFVATPV